MRRLALCLALVACDSDPLPPVDSCTSSHMVGADTCGPLPELDACMRALSPEATAVDGWCLGERPIRYTAKIDHAGACRVAWIEAKILRPTSGAAEVVCESDVVIRWGIR